MAFIPILCHLYDLIEMMRFYHFSGDLQLKVKFLRLFIDPYFGKINNQNYLFILSTLFSLKKLNLFRIEEFIMYKVTRLDRTHRSSSDVKLWCCSRTQRREQLRGSDKPYGAVGVFVKACGAFFWGPPNYWGFISQASEILHEQLGHMCMCQKYVCWYYWYDLIPANY